MAYYRRGGRRRSFRRALTRFTRRRRLPGRLRAGRSARLNARPQRCGYRL